MENTDSGVKPKSCFNGVTVYYYLLVVLACVTVMWHTSTVVVLVYSTGASAVENADSGLNPRAALMVSLYVTY